ncbi:MAG: TlpA family protein disulfide reductase [Myxococcales bacterium]|nr:TlpA family protein disulfide reductase [Myxococcales bacterium]
MPQSYNRPRRSPMRPMRPVRSPRLGRLLTCLAALAGILLAVAPVRAADDLLLPEWLGHPGVRLIAVDFYATWCTPCMEAMPRWRALHDKYYKQGLRVVLVSTQDPDAGCRGVGFTPFQSVCDLDGRLSQQFALQGKLPAAFLWSWQGNLLVRKGHIDEVEREVERYLKDSPRVLVRAAKDVPAAAVDKLRERLTDDGKVLVVAAEAEVAALDQAKKHQQGPRYDERQQCELGREVPPNALLQLKRVAQGKDAFLHAGLLDLESGCQLQSASAPWGEPKDMAAQAVAALLSKLKLPSIAMPQGASAGPTRQAVAPSASKEAAKTVDLGGGNEWVVAFTAEPAAAVLVDGKMLCPTTPCSRELPEGSVAVEFQAVDYLPDRQRIAVSATLGQVHGKLAADFGLLRVTSEPAGLHVDVNGKPATTPVSAQRVVPGKPQVVRLADSCYLGQEQQFAVARGDSKTVAFVAEQRRGGIRVKAIDRASGDALQAEVAIDDVRVGVTPYKGMVWTCAKEMVVTYGGERSAVALAGGQVQESKVLEQRMDFKRALAEPGPGPAPGGRPVVSTLPPVAVVTQTAPPGRSSASGWVTLVLGAGVASVGGYLWSAALQDETKLQAAVAPGMTPTYEYSIAQLEAASLTARYQVAGALLAAGTAGVAVGVLLVATVDGPKVAIVPSRSGFEVVGRW